MLNQTCVYWGLASTDSGGVARDKHGQPLYTSAVELDCRWEDKQVEFIDSQGVKRVSKSVVYVESDVDIAGVLMLGTLSDITDAVNIKENSGAQEIKGFDKIPDFDATEFLRAAYL
jgi:hypothetical protein